MSDYSNQVLEEAKRKDAKSLMPGWFKLFFTQEAKKAIQEAFLSKVAAEGKTFTVYKCKLIRKDDVIVAYPASDKYSDAGGQLCRQLVYDDANTDYFTLGSSGEWNNPCVN